jgi:hypothetical protein
VFLRILLFFIFLFVFVQITYLNNPELLFLFIEALENLDRSNVSNSLVDANFSSNVSIFSMSFSVIHIVCHFLKLNFNIQRTTPVALFLYFNFSISHADICAQAFYDLFTIHLIVNFYVKQFNNVYSSYNWFLSDTYHVSYK